MNMADPYIGRGLAAGLCAIHMRIPTVVFFTTGDEKYIIDWLVRG